MRKSKWILMPAALAVALAAFVVLTGCEDKPSTDVSMGDYTSLDHDSTLLSISPNSANVTYSGQQVVFRAQNGSGSYSWTCGAGGTIAKQSESEAIYTVTALQKNTVTVTDSRGNVAMASITLTTAGFSMLPISATLADGGSQVFTFSGGTQPYTFYQLGDGSKGTAVLSDATHGKYQDLAGGGAYTNTVVGRDDAGATIQATIVVN